MSRVFASSRASVIAPCISSRSSSGSRTARRVRRSPVPPSSSPSSSPSSVAAASPTSPPPSPSSSAPSPLSGWDRTAVVIVDHGSRRAEANAELEEFATLYRSVSGRPVVEIAHMEIASPTVSDAVAKVAALGASRVVLAPYFLSRGRHVREDIPALAAEAQREHGLTVSVAEPFGVDAALAAAVEARVRRAEEAEEKEEKARKN